MSRPIEFYTRLLTSQYQTSPKLISFLEVLLQKLEDISDLADVLDSAFDLDTAEGVQLDILGQIVGVGRQVNFQPRFGLSPILNDSDYRILLKATIGEKINGMGSRPVYTLFGALSFRGPDWPCR